MRRADAALDVEPAPVPLLLVGTSAAARRLADDIRAVADASCVLLEGEDGLDAVDIAREIHAHSTRPGRFVAIECGAAEPAVVERELFGGEPRRAIGDLEAISPRCALASARGGTLYLEDISDLSAAAQARLSRVLRDGEVRVGGDASRLDVCFVLGSSTGFEADVNEGRVRRDIARHVARSRVAIAALRRRAEDIPHMLDMLIAQGCDESDVARKSLTQAATTLLAAMPWHGNLTELRNAVARLVSGAAGEQIQLEDVLAHVRFDGALSPHAGFGTLRSARQQFERDYISSVLQHHRGRVGDAARALGIQRTNLYRKARQLGISVARTVQSS